MLKINDISRKGGDRGVPRLRACLTQKKTQDTVKLWLGETPPKGLCPEKDFADNLIWGLLHRKFVKSRSEGFPQGGTVNPHSSTASHFHFISRCPTRAPSATATRRDLLKAHKVHNSPAVLFHFPLSGGNNL